MKLASSIVTWLVALANTVLGLVNLIYGVTTPVYKCYNGYYGQNCQIVWERQPAASWLWVVFFIALILRIVILIWRQYSINHGKKVGCGVCTLIFVSLIGGILTLCIPEDDLYEY